MDATTELARIGCEQGLALTGPVGLLKQLTKVMIKTTVNAEMTEHLGFEKNQPSASPATCEMEPVKNFF